MCYQTQALFSVTDADGVPSEDIDASEAKLESSVCSFVIS